MAITVFVDYLATREGDTFKLNNCPGGVAHKIGRFLSEQVDVLAVEIIAENGDTTQYISGLGNKFTRIGNPTQEPEF